MTTTIGGELLLVIGSFDLLFSPPRPTETPAYHQGEEKAECRLEKTLSACLPPLDSVTHRNR